MQRTRNKCQTAARKKQRVVYICCLLFAVCYLTGCSSMVQKGGEILEGSASGEMELAYYRSIGTRKESKVELRELREKDGKIILEITSSAWPGFALHGTRPGGSGVFSLTEARILSSHVHGWNEFTLDILGNAVFDDPKKSGSTLYTARETERVQISSGKIRLKSSRLTGEAALTPLRNRRERILAIIEWMQINENQKAAVFVTQKEFAKFWKPKLFPELVMRKNRPPEYSNQNAQWQKADSIKWNTSYTELLFPEELPGADQFREYRNTGALLRDWEEALPWIYMEYSWDYIVGSFNGIVLQKIK